MTRVSRDDLAEAENLLRAMAATDEDDPGRDAWLRVADWLGKEVDRRYHVEGGNQNAEPEGQR